MLGRIFSIEEFSTYDGPGIRMSVFLKGCPLRCMWCHNPEGQGFEAEIVRSPNGCLDCGVCLEVGKRVTGRASLVPDSVSACPRSLVRVCGEDISVEALTAKIDKNIAILNASGGGVTFSGGEPLSQHEFLLECLKALKGKTDRAVQTCGYAPEEIFGKVLEECDRVLYDLKLIDSNMHKYYTGVSNEKIIQNYRTLSESGVDFLTRIPLIPTVNDTVKNITDTAKLMNACGVSYVELLPYNRMAGGKYLMLGRTYETDFDGDITPQSRADIFNYYGIEVKIL